MPKHAERDICPSVRLSVTRWYCIETNAHIVKLITLFDYFFDAYRRYKIPRALPQRGRYIHEWWENCDFRRNCR